MTNDELTPAEALRALADGEMLTSDYNVINICAVEGCALVFRCTDGTAAPCYVTLKGWRRIPKRDVGMDPRVGDVLIGDKERFIVLYAGREYVLVKQFYIEIGGHPLVIKRTDWREWFQSKGLAVDSPAAKKGKD